MSRKNAIFRASFGEGIPVGGEKLYQHCIKLFQGGSGSKFHATILITNKSSEAFTKQTLYEWLDGNGFASLNTQYPASGYNYDRIEQKYAPITGVNATLMMVETLALNYVYETGFGSTFIPVDDTFIFSDTIIEVK